MKPNNGFITVLMMVLISISLSTFSRAAFDTFSDVPNDSPFHESIFYLAERGIVCGEGNGRYVPDAPVTVRQWATMLCRALGDADPLNYDDDCIRQGYSDGWLEMTAITAPDSDLCRYAIYKSGYAAFGVDLYSLQLYPNEGKLSQQSEVLRAAADFGLCEETCDGTEIITRGEAAELLYALLTKTFAVVPPPMLDNIPLDNKAGVALNNYLLEIQKIPESMMQSFAEKDWRYVIDFDYLAKLSKEYDLGCTGATIYEGRKIIVSSAESTIHEFGHFLDGMMGFPSRTKGIYQRESASAASLLRTYALTDAQEYFADCFVYWIKNRGDGKRWQCCKMLRLRPIITSRCSRKMTGNPVYRLSSKENLMKRIYHFYLTCMTLTLTMPMMIVSAFAVDDMWTVANKIIVDVYGKIVGVSTVLAGLMSAVAVIGAKLSNNQHKVDQAWDWLKRIWIAWAIINGIGAFIAYVAPLFNGLATP